MERNQLKYVIEVARHENITHAAEVLHLAQPSLSNQILKLEQELGVSLFERSRKRVYLTEAGKNFVYQAKQILNSMEQLEKDMKDYAARRMGSIQIGALPTMVSLGIPDIITKFRDKYRTLEITLREMGSSKLYQSVQIGELDAVINTANPLSKQKELSINSLKDQHIISSSSDFSFPSFYLTPLHQQNIPYMVSSICNQIESVFALVEKNFGITFCSKETSRHYPSKNIVYIPIRDMPSRKIYLIYKKSPEYHPTLQAFIDFVLKCYDI